MSSHEPTKLERIGTVQVPENASALLSINQIATLLDFSPRQIRAMISAQEYPKADLVLGNRPRWKVETHNAWVEQQVERHKTV